MVRLLLTSAGIRNESMRAALAGLVGGPFREANLVFIATAATAQAGHHDWLVADINRVYTLGWNEFNLLELNGLPAHLVRRRLERADVIYVGGGNAYHLARSIADTDLADDLRDLLAGRVYVGASAGSMILTRRLTDRMAALYGTGDELYQCHGGRPVSPLDQFDWWLLPHVDFTTWDPAAAGHLGCPVYAIDDQTAVRVVDRHVDVISEGRWTLVNPAAGEHPRFDGRSG